MKRAGKPVGGRHAAEVDMSEFLTKVDKTLRYHCARGVRGMRYAWWHVLRPPARRPVFVIGCSRAGTTLVYKTFSRAAELGSLNRETHDIWAKLHPLEKKHWDTHALGAEDATDADREYMSRYFYGHTGRERFVDKNNQNGLCVPYLNELFPDAYFVFVKRSPGDNLNSLIEGWGRPEEFATWSEWLPATVQVDNGRYTRWCFFLAEGWREYLARPIEEVCAFQYRAMNAAILEARETVDPERWTELSYEDLVTDPVEGFRTAFESVGLQFGSDIRQHCENVLSRPYNAFSEIRLDKWREGPHAERIERVLPDVAGVASDMGYGEPLGR